MEEELRTHLSWDKPIKRIHGAAFVVQEIDVYVDFDWQRVVGHPQRTFLNYRSLATHIKTTREKAGALLSC